MQTILSPWRTDGRFADTVPSLFVDFEEDLNYYVYF